MVPQVASKVAVALIAVLALTWLGPAAAQSTVPVVYLGMTPASESGVTLASINSGLAGDVANAMEIFPDQVVLLSAGDVAGAAGSYNATIRFIQGNRVGFNRTAEELSLAFESLVSSATSSRYVLYLQKYGIEAIVVGTVAITTTTAPTVAPTPPPTTATAPPEPTNATNATMPATTTEPAPTFTPVPTQPDPRNSNTTFGDAGEDEGNNGLIYAIVFGVIGGVLIIGAITFCAKKYATREKKDHTKRGGGYKYAARSVQHH